MSRACLGNLRLNSAQGIIRASLMGSWGVHGVVEGVCNVVMKVHKAGVTGTGRSGTVLVPGFRLYNLSVTSQGEIEVTDSFSFLKLSF